MTKLVHLTFDGKAFVPDENLDLPVNSKHQIEIEISEPATQVRHKWLKIAAEANFEGPSDLSTNMYDYMYGDKRGQY